jgi:hypothetical protein
LTPGFSMGNHPEGNRKPIRVLGTGWD